FTATSLRDEDKEVNDWFSEILRSLSIDPVFGDEPETQDIPDKVKRMISEHDHFIAILLKRDKLTDGDYRPPDWVNNEIGIAFAFERNIVVFMEEGVSTRGLTNQITNYVRFDRNKLLETMPKIISYLLTLFKTYDSTLPLRLGLQSYYASLNSLQSHFNNVKTLLEVEDQINNNKIQFLSVNKKNGGLTAILKGGKDTSLSIGTKLSIIKKQDQDTYTLPEKVGTIKVLDVLDKITQCKIEERTEDFWDFLSDAEDGIIQTPDNIIEVVKIPGTANIGLEAVKEFLTIFNTIITACKEEIERYQRGIRYGY
ncbi:MAG: hypothetical protein ACTSQY_09380, partial [Candidatus Odinarchaeia archaeon]